MKYVVTCPICGNSVGAVPSQKDDAKAICGKCGNTISAAGGQYIVPPPSAVNEESDLLEIS